MGSASKPMPIGELIRELTHRFVEGHPLYAVWQVWRSEVGEEVARHARPIRLRRGVLTVAVSGSAWMQEVHFMKSRLVERLREAVPGAGLKEIFLVADREEGAGQGGEGNRP